MTNGKKNKWSLRATRGFKYGNVVSGGKSSKLENAVYAILQLEQKAGLISDLKCQVHTTMRHPSGKTWKCIPDFSFTENGETVYAEAKGFETDRWLATKFIWESGLGPGKMRIYAGSYKKPFLSQVLIPYGYPGKQCPVCGSDTSSHDAHRN